MYQPCPDSRAVPGSNTFPEVLVGPIMAYLKSKTIKKKSKSKSRSKSDEDKTGMELESEPRVVLTPIKGHSRASSVSLNITDDLTRPGTSGLSKKRKPIYDTETDMGKEEDLEVLDGDCLMAVAEERKDLEKFLFDEGKKVTRPVIRYILKKWAAMEARLQCALVENETLKERNKRVDLPSSEKFTYAEAAAMKMHEPRPQGAVHPKKKVSPTKKKYEVVLIKSEKEDKRNNDK